MPSIAEVPFEKHVLDNGLQVILHEDRRVPVVAVCVVYHVGSAREVSGRTGFAHLFEHLMFEGSQHVKSGEHFRRISEAGGTLNGTTSRDRTNYFETLPANQLEVALWLEADRMGFLLPAITQDNLDNQRDVVKNERRQNYENRPYAKILWPMAEALYPAEHPYSWLTIGSHEDLDAATVEDVQQFFRRWYGPNNATICVGGDQDKERTLELVQQYFGSIPRGPEVGRPIPWSTSLPEAVRRVVEDDVQLPELSIVWPTVPRFSAEEPAVGLLLSILSANKSAILDRALMVEEGLAQQVIAHHSAGELAGELRVTIRAKPGVTLSKIETRVHELLDDLNREGVGAEQLARQKSRYESSFIHQLETVHSRTNTLAECNALCGDPVRFIQQMERALVVTPDEVEEVFRRYVHRRPALYASVVPKGQLDLAAGGDPADPAEAGSEPDRAAAPSPGPTPLFKTPAVRHQALANGVPAVSTETGSLPVVALQLSTPGGHLRESREQLGLSLLTTELMNEGTRSLSSTEFTNTLDSLGADFRVSSGDDEITVTLRTLERHLTASMELLEEVLLAPRMDPDDFDRLRSQQENRLLTRGDSIRTITEIAWRKVLYGPDGVAGFSRLGTPESVKRLRLEDATGFFKDHLIADQARVNLVASLDRVDPIDGLSTLVSSWPKGAGQPVDDRAPLRFDRQHLFLIDKPDAPQSEIRVGHAGIERSHPDYSRLGALNFILGGSFSSRINTNLREDKGYTYGAFSRFSGGLRPGSFTVWTAVEAKNTGASVTELLDEIRGIVQGVTPVECDFARDSLMQAMTRRYESISSLLELVAEISKYGLPDDFPERHLEEIRELSKEDLDQLAQKYIYPEQLAILVVGDAKTVLPQLQAQDLPEVQRLDIDGDPI